LSFAAELSLDGGVVLEEELLDDGGVLGVDMEPEEPDGVVVLELLDGVLGVIVEELELDAGGVVVDGVVVVDALPLSR
jgi:hypothetical protein